MLNNNVVLLAINSPQIKAVVHSPNLLLAVAKFIRQKSINLYASTLSPEYSSLLLGIVLGIKANFSKSFLTDLQSTGVMHVIAASGMNVTMTGSFFLSIFTIFLHRKLATILSLAVILIYMVLSGLQASILRAGIMIIFAFGAQLFGRQYLGAYGLFLAGSFMLIQNPLFLWDVGFQLSMLATLGILTIKPLLKWGDLFEDLTTTLAAQVATLPILLTNFGTYGIFSILVNALVLWTIPMLMVLGGVGLLLGFVIEPLGKVFLIISVPLLWYFERVVEFFGGLGLNLQVSTLPIEISLGYYLLVISWVTISRINDLKN